MSEFKDVQPCRLLRGCIRVPGDKSISHRTAMLSALARGDSLIEGFLDSEDCLNTLRAVEALGARVARDGTTVRVTGTGGRFRAPAGVLDMGNSGTGIRLLAGLLAGQSFTAELTGDRSLCSRPMERIQEPLQRMGARVELLGEGGCAPIRVAGGPLRGITYTLPMASAQVKSCVLLAGLFAEGETVVIEPKATRDHTERLLRAMGLPLAVDGLTLRLQGGGPAGPALKPGRWGVPADFSSAAFWMVAAACARDSDVTLANVGLNPRRTALVDVLQRMGADVQIACDRARTEEWEPCGDVRVRGGRLRGTEVGGAEIPNLIDELPLVAVLGAFAEGATTIRDAAELRVKESDRIAVMARVLRAMGVPVEERPDGMVVHGPARIAGGVTVDSAGDHRVAMCAAILGLFAAQPVRVTDTACIATSYPGFWHDLERLAVA